MEASMRMEIQGNWLWKRQTYVGSYKIPSKLWLFRFFFFFFGCVLIFWLVVEQRQIFPQTFLKRKTLFR